MSETSSIPTSSANPPTGLMKGGSSAADALLDIYDSEVAESASEIEAEADKQVAVQEVADKKVAAKEVVKAMDGATPEEEEAPVAEKG